MDIKLVIGYASAIIAVLLPVIRYLFVKLECQYKERIKYLEERGKNGLISVENGVREMKASIESIKEDIDDIKRILSNR